MRIIKKTFGIKVKEINSGKSELSGLDKFNTKNAADRMKDIMILGDTGNSKAFEILQHAILNDQDSRVVEAGLKRLPNFKEDERFSLLLEKLKNKVDIKKYEPYYSMTLLNLGLINEKEFNKIFKE